MWGTKSQDSRLVSVIELRQVLAIVEIEANYLKVIRLLSRFHHPCIVNLKGKTHGERVRAPGIKTQSAARRFL